MKIIFAKYDQFEISINLLKHHIISKDVMFTMSKERVHLTGYLIKLHKVIAKS